MRKVRWGGLGVLVGAVLGVVILLLPHVPASVAVLLGLAATAACGFSCWADRVWRKRTRPGRRVDGRRD